jgi:integrase
VRGLEAGRTEAPESKAIGPVADAIVEATLPHLTAPIAAMVRIQRLTGARPGEICSMRGCDLDTTGTIWLYRLAQHKTAYRGKTRVIAIGPRCQEVIKPFLKLETEAYLFSPRDALANLRARQRAARKTKVQPSQVCRKKRKPKRTPGLRYKTTAYSAAIRLACVKHGIEHWHPNQLRHSHATDVRRQFGLEAAQVALGHAAADVTQIYAERDLTLRSSASRSIDEPALGYGYGHQ